MAAGQPTTDALAPSQRDLNRWWQGWHQEPEPAEMQSPVTAMADFPVEWMEKIGYSPRITEGEHRGIRALTHKLHTPTDGIACQAHEASKTGMVKSPFEGLTSVDRPTIPKLRIKY